MLRECLRTSLTILITSWILLSGIIIIPVSSLDVEGQQARGSSNFTEEFYMTAHMDSNKTDVVGWGNGGIELVKRPKVTDLSLVGTCKTPEWADGVYVKGDYAYVGTSGSGLQIINIEDPSNPIIVGNCDPPSGVGKVHIVGNYAYVTGGYKNGSDLFKGLFVINITDPINPKLVGYCETPDYPYSLFVIDDYVYITNFEYVVDPRKRGGGIGLTVIDITDPTSPISISTLGLFDYPYDIYVSGNYAYIAGYDTIGLEIIDITNPKNLSHIGRYFTLGRAKGVYVQGNYAYVADELYGLFIINILDPKNPLLEGTYDLNFFSWNIHVAGNYAYISGPNIGLQVINVSNPMNPALAAYWNEPDPTNHNFTNDVFVLGDCAYVTNASGLQIIEIWFTNEMRYDFSGFARSIEIDTTNKYIYNAKLTCENDIPPETEIKYYLSADGGEHWELVTSDIEHHFKNPGNDLRWKAILTTSNGLVTPKISKISIIYEFDSTPPDSEVELIIPSWHNSTMFKIRWYVEDDHYITNISLFYRYSVNNITWTKWQEYLYNNTLSSTSQNGSFSFIAPNGDGYYEFYTIANDLSGNLESMPLVADAIAGVDTSWPAVNPPEAYGIYNNTGTINWSWIPAADTGSGIVGYYVCVSTTLGGSDVVNDSFTTNNWYQISGLQNNNTYYCKIKAKNGVGTVGSYRNGDFVTIDTLPPYLLSIIINNNENETLTLKVNLTLNATDYLSGVDQMSFSSDELNWSAWEPFKPLKSYILPSGNGPKTVYFKVKDHADNIALPVSGSIILNIPESINDTDNDSIPDSLDDDTDNDGYNDTIEDLIGTNPLDPNSTPADVDKDYIPDSLDPDIDGDGKLNDEDQYPYNPKRWEEDETNIDLFLTILIVATAIMIILIVINIKKYFPLGKK